MNRNKLIIKWSEKLGDSYVKNVISEFDFIEKEFYEDRNKEEVIDSYLLFENNIRERVKEIENLKNDIKKFDRMKSDVLSYIINKLRDERKLIDFLKNKDMGVINKIRNLVNINVEYNIVDKLKFEESKRKRGSDINYSLNN
jgi:hypothetical protein